MATYLGFYLGKHDSNLTIIDNGQVYYKKAERSTGIKHKHSGIEFVSSTLNQLNITKLDGVCFTDGDRNGLKECSPNDLSMKFKDLFNAPTYNIDHHYAHFLSTAPLMPIDKIHYGISIDGRGDNERRISIFSNKKETELIYQNKNAGISKLFMMIGDSLGLQGEKIDFAGKIMGLQAYGKADKDYAQECLALALDEQDISIIPYMKPWKNKIEYNRHNPEFLNWLASVHLFLESYVHNLFHIFFDKDAVISYTGGVAQNTVINMRLKRDFPNLIIPPHAYDGGISLGCAEFISKNKSHSMPSFPDMQSDEGTELVNDETIEEIADHLINGMIVGWYQGHGEIGPRALGHRSILLDPRLSEGKNIINKVKKRESWRPFAGSVLATKAKEYFEIDDSPYMLYACKMKKPELTPAIAHVDKTCRIQTVEPDTPFGKLLKAFEKRSGIPILLNTSLNDNGSPIVGKKEDAVRLFGKSKMDILCLGNTILKKH